MERHHAFLKGAIGIEMTPVLKEDDVILSDMAGLDTNIACCLGFPSRTSESGWMDDSLLFNTLEELVTFLDYVEGLGHRSQSGRGSRSCSRYARSCARRCRQYSRSCAVMASR
jgi:hypothetical protein